MIESLLSFFGSTGFMPHGHCYLWTPGLLTLMVGSDVLIALAYFTIPALLIYFIRQRPDVPFPSVFWLFGAFIVCCGLSHLTSVITTWYPLYWFEGIVKLSTGVVSMMTAASLVPVLPQALALRSPAELAEANASLSQRNRELAAANAELDRLYHELVAAKEAQVEAESLRRLNAELEIFTAAVSHDLRAPIRGIIKASSWLEEDAADALDEDSLEILALLRSRSRRLNDMLQGLLQYYRVGIQTFAVKPVSVEELFEEIIEAVDVPQDFSVTTDAQVASVMLPYPPLVQVLGNLFSNAIHHHDRTDGHVHLSAARSEDTIVFIVEDDGPGIPVHLHERAFGVFKTLRPRDEVEGSGIGLALVKRVVERHSGAITLESDEGEGARFIVTWPLPGS